MLTADLVLARRRGDELRLTRLDDAARARALAMAESIVGEGAHHVGETREDLESAIDAIEAAPNEVRVRAGLAKLFLDECTWDEDAGTEAPELRRDVFLRAAAARRALDAGARFDRNTVLAEIASARETNAEAIERGLYADLRGAQTLLAAPATRPATLVAQWERGQAQAVLLRATRISVEVRCASAGATRAVFRRLKFLRLLHVITPIEHGHRIVIDGPFSLFESSTKYGLQLAMVLPVLDGCDEWKLEAEVRWGKERVPLTFRLTGLRGAARLEAPPVPDEVAGLIAAVDRARSPWRVSAADVIVELPGVGLCVPDLVFERDGARVYLEVMGFWSRDAVWRRVELVQSGATAPILFAVSSRLRVSEDVLDEGATGALYVYKGTMSARAILERVEALAKRQPRRPAKR